MEEYKTTYPSDEKLNASTSIKVENRSDIPVTIENWTCGFVFLIDSVNLNPHSKSSVKAEYVWYDFQAKDTNNQVLATISGVYYNRNVIFSKGTDGKYYLSTER